MGLPEQHSEWMDGWLLVVQLWLTDTVIKIQPALGEIFFKVVDQVARLLRQGRKIKDPICILRTFKISVRKS